MRKRHTWCISLLALQVSCAAIAEDLPRDDAVVSEYTHRLFRIEDGLPQNRIRALCQTPDGYLWIGTAEGLARFDGLRFTIFDQSSAPALHDDGILTLRVGRDGALWIGTEGGGLVRYMAGVFRNYGSSEGLTNGFVRAIYEDARKTLWVGTDRGFFRGERDRFVRLDNTPEIPLASVVGIGEDATGKIWVATGSSSSVRKKQRFTRRREARKKHVRFLGLPNAFASVSQCLAEF